MPTPTPPTCTRCAAKGIPVPLERRRGQTGRCPRCGKLHDGVVDVKPQESQPTLSGEPV